MPNQGSYDLRHDVDRLQRKVNVFEDGFADSFFIFLSCSIVVLNMQNDPVKINPIFLFFNFKT